MNTIPRVVHYVWLGGELPRVDAERVAEWARVLGSEWEIKRWDATNFPEMDIWFIREALGRRKWAFASDAMRAYILWKEGGIYLDTDVKLVREFDSRMLSAECFAGFESSRWLGSAVMGANPGSVWTERMWQFYSSVSKWVEAPNVQLISLLAKDEYGVRLDGVGREYDSGFVTYDPGVFYPKHYATGDIKTSEQTVAIHEWAGTWHSAKNKAAIAVMKMLYKNTKISGRFEKLAVSGYEKKLRKLMK